MQIETVEIEKRRARQRVASRVQRGTIPRASELPCEGCGVLYTGNGRTGLHSYHHYAGYDGENALKVKPLCPSCHAEAHYQDGERAAPLILRSIRVSQDVWDLTQGHELSVNQLLRIGLGLELNQETVDRVKKRRESRRETLARKLAESDVTAQAAGRADIDYSDIESEPTTHVTSLRMPAAKQGPLSERAIAWNRRGMRPKGDKSR